MEEKTGPLFSQLRIFPAKDASGNFKGNGRVVVAGVAELSFRIMKSDQGLFVGWPGRYSDKPNAEGKKQWFSDVRIVDEEANQELTKLILDEFRKSVGNSTSSGNSKTQPHPKANQSEQTDQIPF